MKQLDQVWFLAFSLLLILLNLLHSLVIRRLRKKPFGLQTVFDSSLRDSFILGSLNGSVICFVDLVTRLLNKKSTQVTYKIRLSPWS